PDVRPQPYFALLFDRAATAVVATLSLHDALPIWPLGGIDQHDDAIHHRQNALDLAAEIGVTGGIDDVDTGLAPLHRGAFGEDGEDRKSTRLNSSHVKISYAVFCLRKTNTRVLRAH